MTAAPRPVLCWRCERCGQPTHAAVEVNGALSPDPHLCRPAGLGWLRALWQGSGCRTMLHAPAPPSRVLDTARRLAATYQAAYQATHPTPTTESTR